MDTNPKNQIVDKLKGAQNVLVTVSANPSVDQLAAAIGLTLLLNKLDKHATAVFSGNVPSTLEFLKPEATLEPTTDSLRDFIISLDKAKADKLRYKVEENVVKIFITPYRTHLTQDDLNFEQGDFNVDAVVALGVDVREHLDAAIMAHGRILHDAVVVSISAGPQLSDVGSINWQDEAASSLCEMLVSIGESLRPGILDEQIATALLTGIVAETERFSNSKTSPKVMTMSAQLMAAGANQQLIASELQQPLQTEELPSVDPTQSTGQAQDKSVLSVSHDDSNSASNTEPASLATGAPQPETDIPKDDIHIDDHGTVRQPQDYDDMSQMVQDIQSLGKLKERPSAMPRGKTIQPLPVPEPTATDQQYSEYLPEPNTPQPVMASAIDLNDELPLIDPLAPMSTSTSDDAKVPVDTQSPLLSVQDDAESVRPTEVLQTPHVQLPDDGETAVTQPLGPIVQATDTLDQIEDKVEVYEGAELPAIEVAPEVPMSATLPTVDASAPPEMSTATTTDSVTGLDPDAARKAVEAAMAASGGFDPNRPEPLEALNAQPLSGVTFPSPPAQSTPTAPPAVPPPLIPPFPVPPPDQQ